MREGSYSSIRLGLYEPLKEFFGEVDKSRTPLHKKVLCAGISGTIGSAIANPTDLVKIRMQGEGKLEPGMIIFDIWYLFAYQRRLIIEFSLFEKSAKFCNGCTKISYFVSQRRFRYLKIIVSKALDGFACA